MATPHNAAESGDIAKSILLPGDPLRAKFIAENFLENPVLFNSVRNMYGYTGIFEGKKVSVMGTGMGCPSIGLYSYELIHFYGVKNLIRVGSCGAIQKELHLGNLVFGIGANTDSNYGNHLGLPGIYSATASFKLLREAARQAEQLNLPYAVGNFLSSDVFYGDPELAPAWKNWARVGTLAIEMESYALYANAARAGVNALTICTVSDSLVSGEELDAEARQNNFTDMMKVALHTAAALTE